MVPVNDGNVIAAGRGALAVQSLDRGLALLLAFRGRNALSLADLTALLPVHRTSTFRLARTLQQRGFLTQLQDGRYALGPAVRELGGLALARLDVREAAHPILRELASETSETVQLLVRDGTDVLVVDGVESPRRVRVGAGLGERRPLHATAAGKCFLAALPPGEARSQVSGMARLTPSTIVNPAALERELSQVSTLGYAINDGESEPGARFVAAPILSPRGEVLAAVALGAPADRLTREGLDEIAPHVLAAARAVSVRLGAS
jgi:DNA-binding IclR family transcriptional regulator